MNKKEKNMSFSKAGFISIPRVNRSKRSNKENTNKEQVFFQVYLANQTYNKNTLKRF